VTVDREGLEYALETAACADPRALGMRRPDRGIKEEV
jgi:hypothetical protein